VFFGPFQLLAIDLSGNLLVAASVPFTVNLTVVNFDIINTGAPSLIVNDSLGSRTAQLNAPEMDRSRDSFDPRLISSRFNLDPITFSSRNEMIII
jgi:hypothetical protein